MKQNEKTTHSMGEIFANEEINKGLISKIHQYQKTKIGRRLIYTSPKMTYKWHMKRWSTSLVIREMWIKTIMRYYLTPVNMAIIKSIQTINAREGMEKREAFTTVGGSVNTATMENSIEVL